MEKLIITPKTRIFELLQAYPGLEDLLISLAPEFKKLKNPVIRYTVAKVANIGQAAAIGGLNVEEMVNRLRESVGQGSLEQMEGAGTNYVTVCPGWFRKEAVVSSIDIRDMLNRGEQPVHEVLSAVKKLDDTEILEVITPFLPAPLLDKAISLGYRHWVVESSEKGYMVYFSGNQ
jgi:hypothetical protein